MARRVNNDNNNQQADNTSWMVDYSLKFDKCATTNEYYGGYFGGNNNGRQNQNNNNNGGNNNRNGYNGLYEQRLVHFKLCPTSTCGKGCAGGADYVVDMNEYVTTYFEYKAELLRARCETAKANCVCDNAADDGDNAEDGGEDAETVSMPSFAFPSLFQFVHISPSYITCFFSDLLLCMLRSRRSHLLRVSRGGSAEQ